MAADDEASMESRAPAEIRRLLVRAAEREEIERQARRAKEHEEKRAGERARAVHLAQAKPLASRARKWAKAFAREQRLPRGGVEIFVLEGRRAEVTRHGRLVLRSWAKYRGWPEERLEYVSIEFLEKLVAAIDNGDVWSHVERQLRARSVR